MNRDFVGQENEVMHDTFWTSHGKSGQGEYQVQKTSQCSVGTSSRGSVESCSSVGRNLRYDVIATRNTGCCPYPTNFTAFGQLFLLPEEDEEMVKTNQDLHFI